MEQNTPIGDVIRSKADLEIEVRAIVMKMGIPRINPLFMPIYGVLVFTLGMCYWCEAHGYMHSVYIAAFFGLLTVGTLLKQPK